MVTRIALLLLTNLAVVAVLSLFLSVTGLGQVQGMSGLLVTCFVFGMGGALLSLLISRPMARWSMRVTLVDGTESEETAWLVDTVKRHATRVGIAPPDIGIFPGAPNAFATGPSKNYSLVAVSDQLLQTMPRNEVSAVLAHEIGHVANGDMVTMTLVQGVMNTFVMFISRVVGTALDKGIFKNEQRGLGYVLTVFLLDIIFGAIAGLLVAWVSRRREYRADAAAVAIQEAKEPLIAALTRLERQPAQALSPGLKAFGINAPKYQDFLALWATHPPMSARIAALKTI